MTETILAPARLTLTGITKTYPTVVANDHIDLTVRAGEIHAVLGENGAGKSTLMKIIYGVTRPDAGSVLWEGRYQNISTPAQARRLGIGMVFQHFSLFETLTVAENIALALDVQMPPATLAARIRAVSEKYGLPIDPARLVHSMSVGERQRVEIVRCLLQEPKLLIMDEPTSVLTPPAVLQLFETLRQLASEGCSILYISHKLDEIRALCDNATVLRGGRVSGSAIPKNETNASLAEMMIGGELSACHLTPREPAEVRLALQGLSLVTPDPFGTTLKDIHLSVRSGEIVGIAGVSGNGQKELLAALSGETLSPSLAMVELMGQQAGKLGAAQRRKLGLSFVPEERLGRGAVPAMSLSDNALLTGSHEGMVRHGLVRGAVKRSFAAEAIRRFKVKCGGEDALASSLSGGNLQKFIVGRETMLHPKVMIVAQPTWGVDVGAAQLIRQALIDLRDQGVALLVISEELDELFILSDRICVLAEGRLSPPVRLADTSISQIGIWMSGKFDDAAPNATTAPTASLPTNQEQPIV
ncbi:ABC transporter ATP-binding protein [Herbaspirillum sp. RTI4]|uniref:ABC transporter ATP-binding protein n=1 Tax=Herbaspirillum sp. RTI4 TaxID=3048640 RepID=UPI002AB3D3C7|nr:ABC transporter ATP-binding protein [Herbaspirillum sp. RTI4]MDY7576901.1 ABC transporter ATP-binding protein [Herbaspirillum sp. RTI4]MEA9982493.1 ABC transporter ATP-binding protein [Herbaspirillum sp. RTI4]